MVQSSRVVDQLALSCSSPISSLSLQGRDGWRLRCRHAHCLSVIREHLLYHTGRLCLVPASCYGIYLVLMRGANKPYNVRV